MKLLNQIFSYMYKVKNAVMWAVRPGCMYVCNFFTGKEAKLAITFLISYFCSTIYFFLWIFSLGLNVWYVVSIFFKCLFDGFFLFGSLFDDYKLNYGSKLFAGLYLIIEFVLNFFFCMYFLFLWVFCLISSIILFAFSCEILWFYFGIHFSFVFSFFAVVLVLYWGSNVWLGLFHLFLFKGNHLYKKKCFLFFFTFFIKTISLIFYLCVLYLFLFFCVCGNSWTFSLLNIFTYLVHLVSLFYNVKYLTFFFKFFFFFLYLGSAIFFFLCSALVYFLFSLCSFYGFFIFFVYLVFLNWVIFSFYLSEFKKFSQLNIGSFLFRYYFFLILYRTLPDFGSMGELETFFFGVKFRTLLSYIRVFFIFTVGSYVDVITTFSTRFVLEGYRVAVTHRHVGFFTPDYEYLISTLSPDYLVARELAARRFLLMRNVLVHDQTLSSLLRQSFVQYLKKHCSGKDIKVIEHSILEMHSAASNFFFVGKDDVSFYLKLYSYYWEEYWKLSSVVGATLFDDLWYSGLVYGKRRRFLLKYKEDVNERRYVPLFSPFVRGFNFWRVSIRSWFRQMFYKSKVKSNGVVGFFYRLGFICYPMQHFSDRLFSCSYRSSLRERALFKWASLVIRDGSNFKVTLDSSEYNCYESYNLLELYVSLYEPFMSPSITGVEEEIASKLEGVITNMSESFDNLEDFIGEGIPFSFKRVSALYGQFNNTYKSLFHGDFWRFLDPDSLEMLKVDLLRSAKPSLYKKFDLLFRRMNFEGYISLTAKERNNLFLNVLDSDVSAARALLDSIKFKSKGLDRFIIPLASHIELVESYFYRDVLCKLLAEFFFLDSNDALARYYNKKYGPKIFDEVFQNELGNIGRIFFLNKALAHGFAGSLFDNNIGTNDATFSVAYSKAEIWFIYAAAFGLSFTFLEEATQNARVAVDSRFAHKSFFHDKHLSVVNDLAVFFSFFKDNEVLLEKYLEKFQMEWDPSSDCKSYPFFVFDGPSKLDSESEIMQSMRSVRFYDPSWESNEWSKWPSRLRFLLPFFGVRSGYEDDADSEVQDFFGAFKREIESDDFSISLWEEAIEELESEGYGVGHEIVVDMLLSRLDVEYYENSESESEDEFISEADDEVDEEFEALEFLDSDDPSEEYSPAQDFNPSIDQYAEEAFEAGALLNRDIFVSHKEGALYGGEQEIVSPQDNYSLGADDPGIQYYNIGFERIRRLRALNHIFQKKGIVKDVKLLHIGARRPRIKIPTDLVAAIQDLRTDKLFLELFRGVYLPFDLMDRTKVGSVLSSNWFGLPEMPGLILEPQFLVTQDDLNLFESIFEAFSELLTTGCSLFGQTYVYTLLKKLDDLKVTPAWYVTDFSLDSLFSLLFSTEFKGHSTLLSIRRQFHEVSLRDVQQRERLRLIDCYVVGFLTYLCRLYSFELYFWVENGVLLESKYYIGLYSVIGFTGSHFRFVDRTELIFSSKFKFQNENVRKKAFIYFDCIANLAYVSAQVSRWDDYNYLTYSLWPAFIGKRLNPLDLEVHRNEENFEEGIDIAWLLYQFIIDPFVFLYCPPDTRLGGIMWYSAWHRFKFFPFKNVIQRDRVLDKINWVLDKLVFIFEFNLGSVNLFGYPLYLGTLRVGFDLGNLLRFFGFFSYHCLQWVTRGPFMLLCSVSLSKRPRFARYFHEQAFLHIEDVANDERNFFSSDDDSIIPGSAVNSDSLGDIMSSEKNALHDALFLGEHEDIIEGETSESLGYNGELLDADFRYTEQAGIPNPYFSGNTLWFAEFFMTLLTVYYNFWSFFSFKWNRFASSFLGIYAYILLCGLVWFFSSLFYYVIVVYVCVILFVIFFLKFLFYVMHFLFGFIRIFCLPFMYISAFFLYYINYGFLYSIEFFRLQISCMVCRWFTDVSVSVSFCGLFLFIFFFPFIQSYLFIINLLTKLAIVSKPIVVECFMFFRKIFTFFFIKLILRCWFIIFFILYRVSIIYLLTFGVIEYYDWLLSLLNFITLGVSTFDFGKFVVLYVVFLYIGFILFVRPNSLVGTVLWSFRYDLMVVLLILYFLDSVLPFSLDYFFSDFWDGVVYSFKEFGLYGPFLNQQTFIPFEGGPSFRFGIDETYQIIEKNIVPVDFWTMFAPAFQGEEIYRFVDHIFDIVDFSDYFMFFTDYGLLNWPANIIGRLVENVFFGTFSRVDTRLLFSDSLFDILDLEEKFVSDLKLDTKIFAFNDKRLRGYKMFIEEPNIPLSFSPQQGYSAEVVLKELKTYLDRESVLALRNKYVGFTHIGEYGLYEAVVEPYLLHSSRYLSYPGEGDDRIWPSSPRGGVDYDGLVSMSTGDSGPFLTLFASLKGLLNDPTKVRTFDKNTWVQLEALFLVDLMVKRLLSPTSFAFLYLPDVAIQDYFTYMRACVWPYKSLVGKGVDVSIVRDHAFYFYKTQWGSPIEYRPVITHGIGRHLSGGEKIYTNLRPYSEVSLERYVERAQHKLYLGELYSHAVRDTRPQFGRGIERTLTFSKFIPAAHTWSTITDFVNFNFDDPAYHFMNFLMPDYVFMGGEGWFGNFPFFDLLMVASDCPERFVDNWVDASEYGAGHYTGYELQEEMKAEDAHGYKLIDAYNLIKSFDIYGILPKLESRPVLPGIAEMRFMLKDETNDDGSPLTAAQISILLHDYDYFHPDGIGSGPYDAASRILLAEFRQEEYERWIDAASRHQLYLRNRDRVVSYEAKSAVYFPDVPHNLKQRVVHSFSGLLWDELSYTIREYGRSFLGWYPSSTGWWSAAKTRSSGTLFWIMDSYYVNGGSPWAHTSLDATDSKTFLRLWLNFRGEDRLASIDYKDRGGELRDKRIFFQLTGKTMEEFERYYLARRRLLQMDPTSPEALNIDPAYNLDLVNGPKPKKRYYTRLASRETPTNIPTNVYASDELPPILD